MVDKYMQFQKEYLVNLKVNVISCDYTHCKDNWGDSDYIPTYNRFYFILSGEGYIKIKDVEYYPKPGQLLLMPADVIQSYGVFNKNPFVKLWCHFTAKIGDINLFDMIDVPYLIDISDLLEMKSLFEALLTCHESEKLYLQIKEQSILLEIIAKFLEDSSIESIIIDKYPSMDKLNKILNFIDEHFGEDIKVEQLAQILHFHPNYFTKFFKKHIGITPVPYICKVRIEKAKYLLKTTKLPINEIANEVGFCDIYYFSKAFKNYSGFSPKYYRNV